MTGAAEQGGASERRSRVRRWSTIGAQVVVGLGLGAAIAELVFSWRADGAFPHVNFYVADAELGVRLEPGAMMRFQLRENPRTTIHVNSRGYRGAEWPAPAAGEVIVVGDSQVFGLGVEDDETFSAALAARSGRPVINAGVPTYGPQEYMAVARELLAERRASAVVVVLNFVNDPFEIDRPNRERHAVWDGWAVRSETAPTEVREFPGRRWLFSRSHAVHALRRFLYERDAAGPQQVDPIDLGTPSEGGLQDLARASRAAHEAATTSHRDTLTELADSKARLDRLDDELAGKQKALEGLLIRASAGQFSGWDSRMARGRPGDIVVDERAEASRSVVLTAALIQKAAERRAQYLEQLLSVEAEPDRQAAAGLVEAEAALLAERQRLRARLAAGAPTPTRPASMFRGYLEAFKALCDEHGAELIVVALPIDVQVDPREWAKYGVSDPPDLTDSQILLDDLVADARALGLRALDATPALRAAEPGAFLDHDIHMTPKGHAALAEPLAATLAAPVVVPLRLPAGGLPAGGSFVPIDSEWAASDAVVVRGASAAGCGAQVRRGWLRVQCRRRKAGDRFLGLAVREGETPATMALRTADGLSLVTPISPRAPISARFFWKSGALDLEIRWPAGEFHGAFNKVVEAAEPPATAPGAEALCTCHQQRTGERFCLNPGSEDWDDWPEGCRPACSDVWGDPRLVDACARAFPGECAGQLACAQNDPLFAPPCPEGHVHAFASNACFAACDDAHPCGAGVCTAWQGGGVCV